MARVLAHCGGAPGEAARYLAGAIAQSPPDPEPYALLAQLRRDWPGEVAHSLAAPSDLWQFVLGAYFCYLDGDMDQAAQQLGLVIGYRPEVAWAGAPWFGEDRFLGTVTAAGLADASLNITDTGPALDSDAARDRMAPWFRAIEVVCDREPVAEAMARMAILLRASGRIEESLALCDRADSMERVMLTEVVRAGTWRRLGDPAQTAAAFRRALDLDPTNWSLYLDLADIAAQDGDYQEAADLVRRGLEYESEDVTLQAAGAAYRARAESSVADMDLLLALAPDLGHAGYRNGLIDHALGAPALPPDRIAAARRLQADG
jgi:tetratricopeptide (TPR) repeat protein